MATNFRNIVGKEIGTQRVPVYTVPAATSTTVIGMNLANLKDSMVSVVLKLATKLVTLDF